MKHQKPNQFSDPYDDWGCCEEQLAAILAKPDNAFLTSDYGVIFAKNLPAADYQEGAYYIEHCIESIGSGREIKHSKFPDFPVLKRKYWTAMLKTREEGKEKYNQLVKPF